MEVKLHGIVFVLVITVVLFSVTATATMTIPANEKAKENSGAPEKSPVISENWGLERIDFIHYVKPPATGNPPKTATCYKLLGVKWKTLPVNYIINPNNPQNISVEFVTSTVSTSAETWDAVTSSELFNNTYSVDYNLQYGIQDFKNVIAFGDYSDDSVIAVTSVWHTPVGKKIVEFDMLFNTRFSWGDATVDSTKMDLQNIATHELGHGVGLDDIYASTCPEVTMYGYSSYGEVKKRTVESPDITGLQQMYGA